MTLFVAGQRKIEGMRRGPLRITNMKLYALDMPDDPTALGPWLERQVVGMHLAELVAELSALYSSDGKTPTLADLLEGSGESAIAQGLSGVSVDRLGQLLRHPQLLFELQERVLAEGGPQWLAVPLEENHRALVEQQKAALRQAISTATPSTALPSPAEVKVQRRKGSPFMRFAVAISAIAAMLLVAVFLWPRSPSVNWGWGRPGALAMNLPATRLHMNLLADEEPINGSTQKSPRHTGRFGPPTA